MNRISKFNLNTHDIWKLLALILMFIDHTGLYVFDNNLDFRLIGRLSFPIFAVIYGYHFKDKINTKLLLYGLPIVVVNYYLFGEFFLNILYSFVVGGFILSFYNSTINTILDKILFLSVMLALNVVLTPILEYGLFAFFFMLSANTKNIKEKAIYFSITFILYYIFQAMSFTIKNSYLIILFIILFIESILLFKYTLKDINIKNHYLELLIKIIARYSLEIYVIQAILFRLYFYYLK